MEPKKIFVDYEYSPCFTYRYRRFMVSESGSALLISSNSRNRLLYYPDFMRPEVHLNCPFPENHCIVPIGLSPVGGSFLIEDFSQYSKNPISRYCPGYVEHHNLWLHDFIDHSYCHGDIFPKPILPPTYRNGLIFFTFMVKYNVTVIAYSYFPYGKGNYDFSKVFNLAFRLDTDLENIQSLNIDRYHRRLYITDHHSLYVYLIHGDIIQNQPEITLELIQTLPFTSIIDSTNNDYSLFVGNHLLTVPESVFIAEHNSETNTVGIYHIQHQSQSEMVLEMTYYLNINKMENTIAYCSSTNTFYYARLSPLDDGKSEVMIMKRSFNTMNLESRDRHVVGRIVLDNPLKESGDCLLRIDLDLQISRESDTVLLGVTFIGELTTIFVLYAISEILV